MMSSFTTSVPTRLRRTAVVLGVSTALVGLSAGQADAATTQPGYRNYWGAIAVSVRTGAIGNSWDYASASAAQKAARKRCGASDCVAVVTVANGCAALAQARNRALGWAYASTLSAAKNAAMSAAKGKSPRIVSYVCTTRYR